MYDTFRNMHIDSRNFDCCQRMRGPVETKATLRTNGISSPNNTFQSVEQTYLGNLDACAHDAEHIEGYAEQLHPLYPSESASLLRAQVS